VFGSSVVSVAEHVVVSILLLVRNFVPAHEVSWFWTFRSSLFFSVASQMIERGEWKVSDIARNAFDLEGKVVGSSWTYRILRSPGSRFLRLQGTPLLRLCPSSNWYRLVWYRDFESLSWSSIPAAVEAVKARRVENLKVGLI
jgi:formate dehydrogenase